MKDYKIAVWNSSGILEGDNPGAYQSQGAYRTAVCDS